MNSFRLFTRIFFQFVSTHKTPQIRVKLDENKMIKAPSVQKCMC